MPRASALKPKPETKSGNVRAVERAIAILEAFSAKPSMSVLEIQKAVGLSRPTLYRILETLASKGFIRAHGTPQRFSLDYGVGKLAQSWLSGIDVVGAARPILERLREESNETVGLMMLGDEEPMCILELRGPHALTMARGVGPMGHISSGASGKTMLAHLDAEALQAALRTLPKNVDKKRLLDDLARIRRDGFRVSRSEVIAGAISIAAPYFDHAHRVAGAIAVYGAEARGTEDWLARMTKRVVAASAELSAALGHTSVDRPVSKAR